MKRVIVELSSVWAQIHVKAGSVFEAEYEMGVKFGIFDAIDAMSKGRLKV